jgi:hypothetical protein
MDVLCSLVLLVHTDTLVFCLLWLRVWHWQWYRTGSQLLGGRATSFRRFRAQEVGGVASARARSEGARYQRPAHATGSLSPATPYWYAASSTARLLVCLFACLLYWLFVCLFACLLVVLFVCLFACCIACLLVCLFVCLFVPTVDFPSLILFCRSFRCCSVHSSA